MRRGRFVLNLDEDDNAILQSVRQRLGCSQSEAIRWALRWYALGGPWRSPDEPLLPAAAKVIEDRRPVGPLVSRGVG